jgi:hypothetical protein
MKLTLAGKWLAVIGIVMNGPFALFHLMIVAYAG